MHLNIIINEISKRRFVGDVVDVNAPKMVYVNKKLCLDNSFVEAKIEILSN